MPTSGADDANRENSQQEHASPMKRGQTVELRHLSVRKLAFKLGARTRAFWTDQRGVAAIEFGFFAIFLAAALANVTDVSIYGYPRIQGANATRISAQP